MTVTCDLRFVEGVRLFNEREFFACHDEWEEVWGETLGDDREFFQGLIHAAVALHHFEEGNLGGARKLYGSSRKYLEPYAPAHGGIDLDEFLRNLHNCFADLLAAGNEYPTGVTLKECRIPRIALSMESVTSEAPR